MPAKFVVKSSRSPLKDRDKSTKLDIKSFKDKYLGQGFGLHSK